MIAAAMENAISGVPDLLVHIGAGEGELLPLARKAGRAVLIEPDPDRFAELKARAAGAAGIDLIHAALSDRAGQVRFMQASLARFGSQRPVTGARTLFRGLRAAGDSQIRAARLSELIGPVDAGAQSAFVIDAASEAINALDQIDAAGLLTPRNSVFVKVGEIALHEGGAARADVEAWARTRGRELVRVEGEEDPDIWMGWLKASASNRDQAPEAGRDGANPAPASSAQHAESPDQSAAARAREDKTGTLDEREAGEGTSVKLARLEARFKLLEEQHQSQGKLLQKHRNKAYRSTQQLEKARKALQKEQAAREADDDARSKAEAALDGVSRQLTEKNAACSELEQKLASVDDTIASLRSEASQARRAEKTYKERSETLSEQAIGDRARLTEETKTRRKAEADRDELANALKTKEDELEALRSETSELRSKIDELAIQKAGDRARLAEEIKTRRKAEAGGDELANALKTKDDELEGLRSEVSELRSKTDELAILREALERTEARNTELEKELRRLEDQVARAERSNEEMRARIEAERASRIELETSISAKSKDASAARNDLDGVRGDLALALRTQNMVQADLQDLQARHEALQEEKRSLEELLGKLMDRLYDASDRVKALSWAASSDDGDHDAASSER